MNKPFLSFCLLPLLLVGLVLGFTPSFASDDGKEQESEGQQVTLNIGDDAPAIVADRWFQGDELDGYSPEQFYVVEVWATWCGPCIRAMPHLSELAEKYYSQGLRVVALTAADAANTLESVEKFVAGRGKDYRFRYAFCESRTTYDSFMQAAGKNAIPCSFVIDRKGKVAFIGLPRDLDYVLARVAAGKWRGQEDIDEIERINESVSELSQLAFADPKKALQLIEKIEEINPQRALAVDCASAKVSVLTKLERFDEAEKAVLRAKEELAKSNDWGGIAIVAARLASKTENPSGKKRDFALETMESARDSAGDNYEALLMVAIGYRMAGEIELFTDCMQAAIEKCDNPTSKASLLKMLQSTGNLPK